ncbi:MAG TPA: hypothetical protein VH480_18435 [Streptosporangiaceae bacterium]|jgi:hypothetical protein
MRNESAKPREIHQTVTGSAQPYRPGEDELADPDAVIVDETDVASSPADPPHEPEHADAVTDATPGPARTDATLPPPAGTDRAADRAGLTAVTDAAGDREGAGTTADLADVGTTATPASAGTATAQAGAGTTAAPVGAAADTAHLHDRFTAIQSTFVDDPRGSVVAAADLVTEAIETLVSAARERERGLRSEWDRDGADTEDLRNALRDYRGFLDHLATL